MLEFDGWLVGSSVDVASFSTMAPFPFPFPGIRNRLQPCSKRLLPHPLVLVLVNKEYNFSLSIVESCNFCRDIWVVCQRRCFRKNSAGILLDKVLWQQRRWRITGSRLCFLSELPFSDVDVIFIDSGRIDQLSGNHQLHVFAGLRHSRFFRWIRVRLLLLLLTTALVFFLGILISKKGGFVCLYIIYSFYILYPV
jgi:hypothetical protein